MRFIVGLLGFIFLATASWSQNYTLQPGDLLQVEVLEDPSLNRSVLVLPDGSINFPFAGSVGASGRTVSQVQSNLRTALAPNFATAPTVFVSLAQLNPFAGQELIGDLINVYVLGEVGEPGPKQFEPGITFLQALSATGGFTPFAAKRRIQLRRTDPSTGQEVVYKFNLKAVANGAPVAGNSTLREGDIIFVPERRLFE